MTCTSCSSTLESALRSVPGAHKAQVALATEEAEIQYDRRITSIDRLLSTIEDTGFEAVLLSTGEDMSNIQVRVDGLSTDHSMRILENSLLALPGVNAVETDPHLHKFSISYKSDLTGPRRFIEILPMEFSFNHSCLSTLHGLDVHSWIQRRARFKDSQYDEHWLLRWILSTPVQFIIGQRFYTGDYKALRHGSTNMDVLIALVMNEACFYSVYSVLRAAISPNFKGTDFFKTSSMLISFILLGKCLESHINEKMITGEGRPVAKRKGDTVIGGTLIVLSFSTWLTWFPVGKFGAYPKSWIPSSMTAFSSLSSSVFR
ncbi:hypothetical protein CRG98_048014 [Punica granatum]|uniref:HMA domain-containing protein n=1 Tax=Punica granatum TaxID=22663 RepID=A0A2I0HJV1_PUNGR|nr:hypothetical protein CRG98_048014 [Punica granatum]